MLPTATLETLKNGLKLVLVPDDHVESLCFGLFVASGSRHEGPADAGISHFIELDKPFQDQIIKRVELAV